MSRVTLAAVSTGSCLVRGMKVYGLTPTQKCGPVPWKTTQRTSASVLAVSTARRRSSAIAESMALPCSGSFNSTTSTPLWGSCRSRTNGGPSLEGASPRAPSAPIASSASSTVEAGQAALPAASSFGSTAANRPRIRCSSRSTSSSEPRKSTSPSAAALSAPIASPLSMYRWQAASVSRRRAATLTTPGSPPRRISGKPNEASAVAST